MNTKCWDNIQPIKPQLFSEASLCRCLNTSLPVLGLCSGFWCDRGSFLLVQELEGALGVPGTHRA